MNKIFDKIEFFYNKFYYSSEYALVPRLETESLVRKVISLIKNNNIEVLIDVGVGTGIIPISVEKNTNSLKYIYGLDISDKAIEISGLNKELLKSNLSLIKSDLLSVFLDNYILLNSKSVLISANLPYIKEGDFENIGIDVLNEPELALYGGKDTGFELYERFFQEVLKLKNKYKNIKFFVVCEFGFDQEMFARGYFDLKGICYEIFSDLRGINRFISFNL